MEELRKGDGFFARRTTRIIDLRPLWLTEEPGTIRFQMGLSVLCPGHMGMDHRLYFWFLNPCDGGPPAPQTRLYYRIGSSLNDLTLKDEVVWIEGHWSGHVVGGNFIDSLRVG